MDVQVKNTITKQELNQLGLNPDDYEFKLLTDHEYFSLSHDDEEELDKNYHVLTKASYTIYYRLIKKS